MWGVRGQPRESMCHSAWLAAAVPQGRDFGTRILTMHHRLGPAFTVKSKPATQQATRAWPQVSGLLMWHGMSVSCHSSHPRLSTNARGTRVCPRHSAPTGTACPQHSSLGSTLTLSHDASLARSHCHPGLVIRTSPAPYCWCQCPGQDRTRVP